MKPLLITQRWRSEGAIVSEDGILVGVRGEVAVGDVIRTSRTVNGTYVAHTLRVIALDEETYSARLGEVSEEVKSSSSF